VVLVGCTGDDAAGSGLAMELTAAGVQLAGWVVPGGATGTIASLVEPGGQRSVLAVRGADLALPPDDVPPPFPGGHLHLSGHTLLGPGPRTVGLAALAARLAADRSRRCSGLRAGARGGRRATTGRPLRSQPSMTRTGRLSSARSGRAS
jgi:sugar/nucleoside kinase (ribokinase family)